MDDKEKVQSFGDMVAGVDRLTMPWRRAFWLSNILRAIIVALLISYAYLVPAEMTQEQDLSTQHQSQSYIYGATSGG